MSSEEKLFIPFHSLVIMVNHTDDSFTNFTVYQAMNEELSIVQDVFLGSTMMKMEKNEDSLFSNIFDDFDGKLYFN